LSVWHYWQFWTDASFSSYACFCIVLSARADGDDRPAIAAAATNATEPPRTFLIEASLAASLGISVPARQPALPGIPSFPERGDAQTVRRPLDRSADRAGRRLPAAKTNPALALSHLRQRSRRAAASGLLSREGKTMEREVRVHEHLSRGYRSGSRRVEIDGDPRLMALLAEPLHRALAETQRVYRIRVESVGRCGETMVAVDGVKGRLPLLFDPADEAGQVASVVRRAIDRFAL
jgi:hypothetical protein